MKTFYSFILYSAFILTASAQTPMYYKGNGTSNSTFLLGYTSYAAKSQSLYTSYDLQFPPNNSLISTIFYRYGSTGQATGNTLDSFEVNLVQVSDSIFPNNEFYTGTTQQLFVTSLVIPPGNTGDWFPIALQTPFVYDNNQSLVVELRFTASAFNNFGTYGTGNVPVRKIISPDHEATIGDPSSGTWQDFGMDIFVTSINSPEEQTFYTYPNPFSDELYFAVPSANGEITVSITDITGKVVLSERAFGPNFKVSTQNLAKGIYVAQVSYGNKILSKKVIK